MGFQFHSEAKLLKLEALPRRFWGKLEFWVDDDKWFIQAA